MLGDIVGTPGRQAVTQQIPLIRERYQPNLIIANAENAANGSGLTPDLYRKLCDAGVDGMTLGDHVFRKAQIVSTLEQEANIIRPANLPAGAKGKRWMKLQPAGAGMPAVYVVTVLGRLFMSTLSNDPFAAVAEVIASLPEANPIVLVEIHAEATSEKQAMGWFMLGRAVAVVGTHTHVATADARILARDGKFGTAYISDLGMCGPHESVLGRNVDRVLQHMTTNMPAPFDVAERDNRVNGVVIDIDTDSRRATSIERLELQADTSAPPFTSR